MHHIAAAADDVLRRAREAQALVTVGPCARGGQRRLQGEAADHDCQPRATVTPVGLVLPTWEARLVDGVPANVTRDCRVDRRAQGWEAVRERVAPSTPLVIHGDHGPENQSRRTQGMPRRVKLVPQSRVTVRLASSPPSQSKYNPIARWWGI